MEIPVPRTGVYKVTLPQLMKVVECDCSAQIACSWNNCSCISAGLPFTSFCMCLAEKSQYNPHTKHHDDSGSESDESDDE